MKRTLVDFCRAGLMTGAICTSVGVVQGVDVDTYSVQRGGIYTQTSAAAPVPGDSPFTARAIVEGDIHDSILGVDLRTPNGGEDTLGLDDSGTVLHTEYRVLSLAELNSVAPAGVYTFMFDTDNDGITVAQLNMAETAFPSAIPTISNFAATQSVDPSQDFTLTFNAYGNVEGTERWELSIIDDFGFEIYSDAGMGGSVTIPQGFLFDDETHDARLRFVREVTRDTESYPGAVGTVEIYNETHFNLVTGTGGGGGGDDTDPPALFLTFPEAGATDVARNTFITFVFDEEMAPTESIEWSSNVNPANFSYTWQGGITLIATYNGGLPAGATITWKLNPTAGNPDNFRDVAGNFLPVNQFQGSFTTAEGGGDPNDPCNPGGGDDGRGGGSIFKSLGFVQTSNATPVPDPEFAATFNAFFNPGTNQVVSGVSLTTPTGTENLPGSFGNYFLVEEFANATALEAAFPAGDYTLTVAGTGGGSSTVTAGSTTQIPVPQFTNLEALKTFNVASDFTLTFAPFTGAGANDSIFIEISSDEGTNRFMAPDFCVPRELPNTATSVVIPANTFVAGQTLRGSITFSRLGSDSNSIPNTIVVAGTSVRTAFDFTGGGGNPTNQPSWGGLVRNPDGTLTYTIEGDAGVSVSIEGSDSPDGGWSQVTIGVLTGGAFEFTVDPALAPKRFYRAVVL